MDMDTINDIIFVTILFPPVIFTVLLIHELGHFWAARFFNVRIDHFSIGLGRELWSFEDKRKTRWIFRLFPLSGHVHFAGTGNNTYSGRPDGRLLSESPWHVRMLVTAAGPAINVVTPFFLLAFAINLTGLPVVRPLITGVEINEVAYHAGIRPGDKILKLDGREVRAYEEIQEATKPLPPQPISLLVERDGNLLTYEMTPSVISYVSKKGLKKEHGRIGVMVHHRPYKFKALESVDGVEVKDDPEQARQLLLDRLDGYAILGMNSVDGKRHDYLVELYSSVNKGLEDPRNKYYQSFFAGPLSDNEYLRLSFTEALAAAIDIHIRITSNIFKLPLQLLPVDSGEFAPKALVSVDSSVFKYLAYRFFYMASLISVFIAFINLVPLPGLDGSKIVMGIAELAIGRKEAESKRASILFWTLITLYLSVLVINIPNLSVFLGKKVEHAGEFFKGSDL